MRNFHSSQIRVGLARADEDDGLSRDIRHTECRSNLVVDNVHLRQYHPVDTPRSRAADAREVFERPIEFRKLIDSFVANYRLADEEDLVGVVD